MQKNWREIDLPQYVVDLIGTVYEVGQHRGLTALLNLAEEYDRCRIHKTTKVAEWLEVGALVGADEIEAAEELSLSIPARSSVA